MGRRSKRQKRVSRLKGSNKSKIMKINLSLIIGIIVAVLILFSSLTGHKMSIISTKVLSNLVEEVTEEDDTWKIVNMSESEEDTEETENTNSENDENSEESDNTENTTEDNEEQIASVLESSDGEASAVSNEDVTYSADDGVSTASISKSSIYNVGASTINYYISNYANYTTLSYSGDLKKYTTDAGVMFGAYIDGSATKLASGADGNGEIELTYDNIGYDKDGDEIGLEIIIGISYCNVYSKAISVSGTTNRLCVCRLYGSIWLRSSIPRL